MIIGSSHAIYLKDENFYNRKSTSVLFQNDEMVWEAVKNAENTYPTLIISGMNDNCKNSKVKDIKRYIEKYVGGGKKVHAECIDWGWLTNLYSVLTQTTRLAQSYCQKV